MSRCPDENIHEQGDIITREHCASLGTGTTDVKLGGRAVVLSSMANAQTAGVTNEAAISVVWSRTSSEAKESSLNRGGRWIRAVRYVCYIEQRF